MFSLALFSLLAGYFLSAISLFGKAGISLFYTQYRFLRIWWKGALLVFSIWIILYLMQAIIYRSVSRATSNIMFTVVLSAAIAGIYFSYTDFRHSLSHRWLGERFHLGVYLFWLGWIAIAVFLLPKKRIVTEETIIKEL